MARWLGVLAGAGVLLALAWWLMPARRQAPNPPAELRPRAVLKTASVSARVPSEEVTRCVECHAAQSEHFLQTGHAQTLHRAHDPEVLSRFAGQSVAVGQPAIRFRFWQEDGRLWYAHEHSGLATQVSWMFGSGHHGMTPVVVTRNGRGEDEGPDLHVSWYRPHGLALTMGHEFVLSGDPNSLGSFNDAAATQQCFGCHTTELSRKGQGVQTSQLLPGVLCSKCHPNARQHAESMNAGQTAEAFDDWKSLSPLESVNRCGVCHRSPTVLRPEQIHPDNPPLTRFASIGLSLCSCFLNQQQRQREDGTARRLDCLTCHDPHRPMATDLQDYNRRCLECHARPGSTESDCPRQGTMSDCVSCHMPKVKMTAPVSFTDHWIRVRTVTKANESSETRLPNRSPNNSPARRTPD